MKHRWLRRVITSSALWDVYFYIRYELGIWRRSRNAAIVILLSGWRYFSGGFVHDNIPSFYIVIQSRLPHWEIPMSQQVIQYCTSPLWWTKLLQERFLEFTLPHLLEIPLFIVHYQSTCERGSCPCALTEHRAMKVYCGSGALAPRIFYFVTRWRWVVSFTPRPPYPRERAPGTHWIGGWVSSRVDLDALVKREIPNPCRDSNPRSSSS
jgi:hypothetical protein